MYNMFSNEMIDAIWDVYGERMKFLHNIFRKFFDKYNNTERKLIINLIDYYLLKKKNLLYFYKKNNNHLFIKLKKNIKKEL